MDNRPPKIEVGDQNRRFQLCLGERQVDRGKGLAFGGDALVTTMLCRSCPLCM